MLLNMLISGNSKKLPICEYMKRTALTFFVQLNDCLPYLFQPKKEIINGFYLRKAIYKGDIMIKYSTLFY
jgi:hypothetical protein